MSARPHIVVVGSSNTDMVVRSQRLPCPGETLLGGAFSMVSGGKGANQAVAAARLGAQVTFVARIGADMFGDNAVRGFDAEGIDTRFIIRDPNAPSGVALIGVDETTGENAIVVASGANARLSVADVEAAAPVIQSAQVLLCQLETPLETVAAALKIAHDAGVTTILNPAPAQVLPDDLLASVDVLTPNETETAVLVGGEVENLRENAARLLSLGKFVLLVTLGAKGVLELYPGRTAEKTRGFHVPEVVDTTAAGDCFNGALAVVYAEGRRGDVWFANAAAALSVTKAGAQPSLPTRAAVEAWLKEVHSESRPRG